MQKMKGQKVTPSSLAATTVAKPESPEFEKDVVVKIGEGFSNRSIAKATEHPSLCTLKNTTFRFSLPPRFSVAAVGLEAARLTDFKLDTCVRQITPGLLFGPF